MGKLKAALLKVLDQAETGSISKENIMSAKNILGEHVGRGPHVMKTDSLSDPAFLKHENFYKQNEGGMRYAR